MASFHKLVIIGNVGGDAEKRFIPSGDAVTSFSLAVNEKKGNQDKTVWYRVSCWNKLADIAEQYVKKGGSVYVEGTPRLSEYTGRDGTTKTSIEVSCQTLKLLGSKADAQDQGNGRSQEAAPAPAGDDDDDSIPF